MKPIAVKKSRGRSHSVSSSPKLKKKHKLKFYLKNALKFAIEKKELFIHYQPIFDLVTKKMVGVEALLRWNHPIKGSISPDVFIPLAEQSGLMVPIGEWVLWTVCEQGEKWHAAGFHQLKLSVNVSSYQLIQKNLPQLIRRILKKTNIPPELFDLELTETAFVMHEDDSEKVLKKIHAIGVNISIDDFGTGHSSLTRLSRLPLKSLKIDKSFVQTMSIDSTDAIIVKSLITLGKDLGLNVIAEGVETEDHLQFLINNNCPHAQGHYLSKPLSALQLTRFLKKK